MINLSACPANTDVVAEAAEAITLTNVERTAAGVPALQTNTTLNTVAADYARTMATEGFSGHQNPNTGERVGDRVTAAGYAWIAVAENLAYGHCTAQSVVQGWMNSTDHRENMPNAAYTEIGIGAYHGGDEEMYWVQVLATPG